MKNTFEILVLCLLISLITVPQASAVGKKVKPEAGQKAETLEYKKDALASLVRQVPEILQTYDPQTGRFGSGIWISTDQNQMYALAAAYSINASGNPYYKDQDLLEVIMKAGDALIEDADEEGKWTFRKKDGSTWGQIWMPWTYSRWIRSFMLVKSDMPADRRQAWEKAFDLAFSGISRTMPKKVQNIPAHHAMGLYFAGKALDRPQWCEQAGEFLVLVASEQNENGYWSENCGPVMNYSFVYVDALGTYYAASGDKRMLPSLEKASHFHYRFRYPDGRSVETIDERNPYRFAIDVGNLGFSFCPVGRAYLKEQWARYGFDKLPADVLASLLLFGEEGPTAKPAGGEKGYILEEDGKAMARTIHEGPWFMCLSAYATPIPKSRWIQDRQNLVSIFHEKTGLILGGGNTKLQPAWSNFTVGDMNLLQHQPGDKNPDFLPKPGGQLFHVPTEASLLLKNGSGLDLKYGPEECRIRIRPVNDHMLKYIIETAAVSDLPVTAHLTLLPYFGKTLLTGGGETAELSNDKIEWSPSQVGGELTYAGCRLSLPQCASVGWPVLPHNPYRDDGHARPGEARIVIRIPFDKQNRSYTITMEILQPENFNSPDETGYKDSIPSYR